MKYFLALFFALAVVCPALSAWADDPPPDPYKPTTAATDAGVAALLQQLQATNPSGSSLGGFGGTPSSLGSPGALGGTSPSGLGDGSLTIPPPPQPSSGTASYDPQLLKKINEEKMKALRNMR